jgi:hypothetical protein
MTQRESSLIGLEGAHKIRDESVDVDIIVGISERKEFGFQLSDVTPASCPTSNASKDTEK